MLAGVPWRLIGYVALSAAIILGGWWLGSRLERAKEADRLETELAGLRATVARYAEQSAKAAREAAEARAREAELAARVAAIPKEKLVYVREPKPAQPGAPAAAAAVAGECPRLSDDFLRAYNEAVTGAAR